MRTLPQDPFCGGRRQDPLCTRRRGALPQDHGGTWEVTFLAQTTKKPGKCRAFLLHYRCAIYCTFSILVFSFSWAIRSVTALRVFWSLRKELIRSFTSSSLVISASFFSVSLMMW